MKTVYDRHYGEYQIKIRADYHRLIFNGKEMVTVLCVVYKDGVVGNIYDDYVDIPRPAFSRKYPTKWKLKVDKAIGDLRRNAVQWINERDRQQRVTDNLTDSLVGI